MTLKEIYTWIEDHFPYFREVAKPGWKVLYSQQQMGGEASECIALKHALQSVYLFVIAEFDPP